MKTCNVLHNFFYRHIQLVDREDVFNKVVNKRYHQRERDIDLFRS